MTDPVTEQFNEFIIKFKNFGYPGHVQRLNKAINIIIPKVNLHYFICVAALIL